MLTGVLVITQYNYCSKTVGEKGALTSLLMHHMSKEPTNWSTAVTGCMVK